MNKDQSVKCAVLTEEPFTISMTIDRLAEKCKHDAEVLNSFYMSLSIVTALIDEEQIDLEKYCHYIDNIASSEGASKMKKNQLLLAELELLSSKQGRLVRAFANII